MKILFLDFDGVLHPLSAGEQLDPHAPISDAIGNPALFCYAQTLADIIEPHRSVGIIVHSTWRLFTPDDDIVTLLGPLGEHFSGVRPRATRYESIRWLVQQNRLRDFRVIDDAPSEFPRGLRELIVCDSERGISERAVQNQIRHWLQGTEYCKA